MFGTSSHVQMTFNSRLKRVRVEFTPDDCFAHRKPPRDLLDRVEDRFKEELREGFIETYLVFSKRFEDLWSHIRSLEGNVDPKRKIKFTLGQGGRLYSEIVVRVDPHTGAPHLTATVPPKKMSTISFSAFLFNVMLKLNQQSLSSSIDRAQLKFLYLLLKNGETLDDIRLLPQPGPEDNTRAGSTVRLHPDLKYASLHVFDPDWLASEANCRALMRDARAMLQKLDKNKVRLQFLEEHSLEKAISLSSKMQAFGFHMPYDLLIAYDIQYRLNANLLKAAKIKEADLLHGHVGSSRENRLSMGDFLTIEIDPDGMKAHLLNYKRPPDLTKDRLIEELQKAGVSFGFETYLAGLFELIQNGGNPDQFCVAQGRAPEPGQTLELHFPHQDLTDSLDSINMREQQNHRLVRKGGLIAEVRYSDGTPGMTVESLPIFAKGPADAFGASAGDGVELRNGSEFYATRNGLLSIDAGLVSCLKTYVHKGSVNFASGNIRFEGAVVIEGDIEAGSTVEIDGTLIVKGSIEGAKVRCSGDLEVKGGVNTGKNGYVHIGGQARFAFIENSVIQGKRSVIVQKSITNSLVIAGEVVHVLDHTKGMILGGLTCAWQAILVGRFGNDQGQTTQCRVGSHHEHEIRLQRLASRLKFFQKAQEENQKSITLLEKPGQILSPAQATRYAYVKKNAKRYQRILSGLKSMKDKLTQAKDYNPDATLIVYEILNRNSLVWMSGKKIPIAANIRSVLVSPHLHDGIIDLENIEIFMQRHPKAIVA